MNTKQLQEVMNVNKHSESFSFGILAKYWSLFWMQFAGLGFLGRIAARLAAWFAPPHKGRVVLARMSRRGYIEPTATIYHSNLRLGTHIFIGLGGYVTVGENSSIHPRCQLNANVSPIKIGCGVMIGPSCALYSYDHGIAPNMSIRKQPLQTKGGIVIDDDVWLGFGVIVLDGVRIGKGAVVGAGSVVTHDVPDNAIAVGVPARIVKMRSDLTL
jgi:acetyltransferase-like isoleucine patch superfamily enzyme